MIKMTWHSDPGHAWLEVTEEQLKALGIGPKISCYSYKDGGGKVFLEEDCDAEKFLTALEKAVGSPIANLIEFRDSHVPGDSVIRDFPRWEGTRWSMEAFMQEKDDVSESKQKFSSDFSPLQLEE